MIIICDFNIVLFLSLLFFCLFLPFLFRYINVEIKLLIFNTDTSNLNSPTGRVFMSPRFYILPAPLRLLVHLKRALPGQSRCYGDASINLNSCWIRSRRSNKLSLDPKQDRLFNVSRHAQCDAFKSVCVLK